MESRCGEMSDIRGAGYMAETTRRPCTPEMDSRLWILRTGRTVVVFGGRRRYNQFTDFHRTSSGSEQKVTTPKTKPRAGPRMNNT